MHLSPAGVTAGAAVVVTGTATVVEEGAAAGVAKKSDQ